MEDMNTVICKNDRCHRVVPPSKNSGRMREFCEEVCRKRYNARLTYQRQTSGNDFRGLRGFTPEGYPKINRKIAKNAMFAERRVKEHGENCKKTGEWCEAKLHDAYNRKKFCLVRAVFTDDWLELMYGEEGKVHEREMTTEDGMWIDDYKALLKATGLEVGKPEEIHAQRAVNELKRFAAVGGMKSLSNKPIPEFPP